MAGRIKRTCSMGIFMECKLAGFVIMPGRCYFSAVSSKPCTLGAAPSASVNVSFLTGWVVTYSFDSTHTLIISEGLHLDFIVAT